MTENLTERELEEVSGGGSNNKRPSQQVLKRMFNNGVVTVKQQYPTWRPADAQLTICFNEWQKKGWPLPAAGPFIKQFFNLK